MAIQTSSGPFALVVQRSRGPLLSTRRALARGKLTIGFVGGSITDPRPEYTWPRPVAAWFVDRYPEARICVENAAIGATGSDLAVFRAQRDLIDRGCDLVFIEFAVNDFGATSERRMRTREGLVRKLLAGPGRDLVFTYTFSQPMYEDMAAGRVPASIAEFEQLAGHYGIGSVWMGLNALQEVQRGLMSWEEWLPDGLHPQNRGSLSYAVAVVEYLERELGGKARAGRPARAKLPAPFNAGNWERAKALPLETIATTGPWSLQRWPHCPWIDRVLMTTSPGARMSVDFTGSGVVLGQDYGKLSADFRWRLDGGEWTASGMDRPTWMGNLGWYRAHVLVEDLPVRRHRLEIETMHAGDPSIGTRFCVALVGVIP